MVFRSAKRFQTMPEVSPFKKEMNAVIQKYESKGIPWFRMLGADVPLMGHRNQALTNYLIQVVKEGWDYYITETNWMQEYKDAVSYFERKHIGVEFPPDNIIAIPGTASGWQLLHNIILNPGDEIVAIEPAHYMGGPVSYLWYLGAKVVPVPSLEEADWEPDLDKLRTNITQKTRAIALDHPNNPTGAIYSEKTRKAIIDVAGENEIPVISDELYGPITFDDNKAPSMATISNDVPVVIIKSFSKFFMKPGWRIGYMCFHDPDNKIEEVKNVCKRIAYSYGHNSTGIALPILVAATRALRGYTDVSMEIAGAMAVKGPMDESKEMVRKLQTRRDYTFKRIDEIEGISVVKPKATLYMFPRVEGVGNIWKTDKSFVLDLLKEKAVAFFPGSGYGNSGIGHFRTLYLNDIPILEEVYNRLEGFIKKYK